jgi:hypothetical protein
MRDHDKTQLTQYLLGDLPVAEIERFDELSVTDEEFGLALTSAEQELVDAHARGELSGAELARFNEHYLASPLRRERAKFAQTFQHWISEQNVEPVAVAAEPKNARRRPSRWGIFQFRRWAWGLAAAALVLLLAGGGLLVQNIRLRRQMEQTAARRDELAQREAELRKQLTDQQTSNDAAAQELARVEAERQRLEQELSKQTHQPSETPEAVATTLILGVPTRGGGTAPAIRSTAGPVNAQLELDPAADLAAYRVSLVNGANGQVLWQTGSSKPVTIHGRKFVYASIPGAKLQIGTYLLRVVATSAGASPENIGDYPFKVVK